MRLVSARRLVPILTFAFLSAPARGAETDPYFDGPYLGLEASRQNTIGGALVAGIDTLAQASRTVVSVTGGYRHQFTGGLVAGLEGSFGAIDGDLSHSDQANGLSIDYKNRTQYAVGGIFGIAVGALQETLIYGYVSETKRGFDVTVRGPLGVGTQKDKQGLLRYGLGLERRLHESFSLRASVGSSRADFGNQRTNFDPNTRIDFALGAIWQF